MTSSTMRVEPTNPKSNWIELSLICGLFVVLSLVGIIWDFTSGLLTSGIDGIMMLFICLMMGGIFSLMILMMLHQAGLLPFFRPSATKVAEAAQKGPAPSAAAAPKPATAVPATSPAAAPPLQPSHPPAALQPAPPPSPPAPPKPAAKPAPVQPPKPTES
jgi:predicted lipid-binding transport protein (Tim44 family)